MLELETALERILAAVPPVTGQLIPLAEAHGRVLQERLLSPIDLPVFDNSAMDGYAVCATNVALAKPDAPVRLRLIGKVAAGETFAGQISPGTCVRIFTGSPLPHGADAVVMQEDTRVEEGEVLILDAAKPWENVRLQGEDMKRGSVLAEPGEVLTAGHLTLLAACGLAKVKAGRSPVIGLLATGSELRDPDQALAPGQIYESNRIGLATLLRRAGAIPKIFPIVADVLGGTRAALEDAFAQCDSVVTSGGVSVGEMDFIRPAFEKAGGTLDYWRVAIKPGRPFAFGRLGKKLLFGLPGNPVSAVVTFLLLVRPAVLRWQGARNLFLPFHPGVLAEPLSNTGMRRHFMRVQVAADGSVRSAGAQASHILSSLALANGLVDVAPDTTLPAGASVQVMRWE